MPSEPFLTPRLVGGRFEDNEIPLEFLADLSALEKLLKELAKARFLTANPTRKRSPPGFMRNVSLRLAAIEDGSAIPNIVLSVASAAGVLFNTDQQYLFDSRDSLVAGISAAEKGGSVTDYIPEKLLGHFELFGRSLREDEAVEFKDGDKSVRFTQHTRQRLITAKENATYTQPVTVVCAVPEADQEKGTFQLLLEGDQRLVSTEFATYRNEVMKAFFGYDAGQRLRVRGTGRFNGADRLQSIDDISSISIVGPLDILLRLEELRSLRDGWHEGEGMAISPGALAWLSEIFDVVFGDELIPPHLYPTLDGGIRAEWTLGNYDVSCEIDPVNRTAEWHELETNNNAEETKSLNLGAAGDWMWMKVRLTDLGGLIGGEA